MSRPDAVPWAADFSYGYYARLIGAAAARFAIVPVGEAAAATPPDRPVLILRHDLDLDPKRALPLARWEAGAGHRATYFVMVRSRFYSLDDPAHLAAIAELRSLGHEIGLHFDFDRRSFATVPPLAELDGAIAEQAHELSEAVGRAVGAASLHRPVPAHLRGPDTIAGLVNANSARWMEWYLSDSRGNWREGEPLPSLDEDRGPVLQLLTHPIWWSERHRPAAIAIEEFFQERARGMTEGDRRRLDEALEEEIAIVRAGRSR